MRAAEALRNELDTEDAEQRGSTAAKAMADRLRGLTRIKSALTPGGVETGPAGFGGGDDPGAAGGGHFAALARRSGG